MIGPRRRFVKTVAFGAATAFAPSGPLSVFPNARPARGHASSTGYANVFEPPYSAVADGKTDDTKALQKALDEVGAAGGGIVCVPTGTYLVATHLTVPAGTALVGVGRAPAMYSSKQPGSTLLAIEEAGNPSGTPFITLSGPNSTVEGITIFYPNQVLSDKPVSYPWTVRSGGEGNVSIVNVLLVNPYQAVDFGTNPTPRHYVHGLYGQPLYKGIWVDQCHDIGRIQDVHFWPFWTLDPRIIGFTSTHASSYILQDTDWEVVEDIFSWGYHVGVELSQSKQGAMNGQMTDIDLDNVDIGFDVSATAPYAVHVSNLNIANAGAGREHVAIWGRKSNNRAELSVRGASFWGLLNQALRWENAGTVSLSDSRLVEWRMKQPGIEILAGRALVHDNVVQTYRPQHPRAVPAEVTAINVGRLVDRVIVHDNQLNGSRIVNKGGLHASVVNNQP